MTTSITYFDSIIKSGKGVTNPKIANLSNGRFILTWSEDNADGSRSGVLAQIFEQNGAQVGDSFLVNTITGNNQVNSAVSVLLDGSFVIAWQDQSSFDFESRRSNIKAQLFSSNGQKVGREFLVDSAPVSEGFQPAVTSLDDGGFLITWRKGGGSGSNGVYGSVIVGQFYDSSGTKIGSALSLGAGPLPNGVGTGTADYEIAKLEDGRLVSTWTTSEPNTAIWMQIFDDKGVSLVAPRFVALNYGWRNRDNPDDGSGLEIIPLKNGGFVITYGDRGPTQGGTGVKGQIFNPTGDIVGSEFLVSTNPNVGRQRSPQGVQTEKGFIVIWENDTQDSIREFEADGWKVGSEIVTDKIPSLYTGRDDAAHLGGNKIGIAWTTGKSFGVTIYAYGLAPSINSGGGGDNASYSINENSNQVTIVTALPGDSSNSIRYNITGGNDAGLFQINELTGELLFKSSPDYESPSDSDKNNKYEVSVRASDGTLEDRQNLVVQVNNVNDAPVFSSSSRSVSAFAGADKAIVLTATDVDGDALTYSVATPGKGTASISGSTLTYMPSLSASGNESLVVTASDGKGGTATQTINVIITAVSNAAPTFSASSQSVTTSEDAPIPIPVAATDANNDALTYTISTAPVRGTTSVSGGTITYTPIGNYNGNDSFVVTASDGKGGTATQTVNVTVTPVNDAPTFSAASQAVSATAGTAKTITLAATDVDGDALTYTVATPGKGTASISGSTLTYTPGSTATGSDSFVVTASDGKGGTATQTINATVGVATSTAAKAFTVNTLPGWVGSVGGNGSIVGSNGFEDIKVLYGQIALDGSFNRGGDIVRVSGNADSYVIGRTSASSAYIEAGTTTKVTIPIGSTGLGIVYDDGVRKLSFSGGAYKIGNQTFSADPTKITSAADGTVLPTGANPSTQAVVSLLAAGLSGGTAPDLTITGKVRIVGTNGVDVIKLGSTGGDLTFDGSFNRGGDIIILNKAAGDYSAAKFSGSTIVITSGIEKLTIPMGSAGLTLRFTDGDRTLVFKSGAFNIGDQVISSATATPLTPSSITLSADNASGSLTLNAGTGSFKFTDDAGVRSDVLLQNFGSDDRIFTNTAALNYNFAVSETDPDDLVITFNNNGVLNQFVLDEILAGKDAFIDSYASAVTAVGWDFMAFG